MFRGTPDIISRQCTAAQRLKNTVLKKQLCCQAGCFHPNNKNQQSVKKTHPTPFSHGPILKCQTHRCSSSNVTVGWSCTGSGAAAGAVQTDASSSLWQLLSLLRHLNSVPESFIRRHSLQSHRATLTDVRNLDWRGSGTRLRWSVFALRRTRGSVRRPGLLLFACPTFK